MLVGADVRRKVASVTAVVVACVGATAFAVLATASPVSARYACDAGPSYVVRAGDGWFAIANGLGVTGRALLDANRAEPDDLLVPGDRLCLPAGATATGGCGNTYRVRSGDGWFQIANRIGASVPALLAVNAAGLDRTIHPGQVLCLPAGARAPSGGSSASSASSGSRSYTVAAGDSWFGIAARAGVSPGSLLGANNATASDVIVPGQVIRLPAGAKQPASRDVPTRQWVDLARLPVQGPCWYGDTWLDARGGGRRHTGTDLITRRMSYVYAVVDGRLTDRSWAQPGSRSGNAWTLTAADGTFFYYAHLAEFAPELRVGSKVRAGQILGWVGDSGNASAAHLHFEIHPDGGAAINPYPILRAEGGCNRGTPYRQPGGWIPD